MELKANSVGDIMDSSNITSNKTDGTADIANRSSRPNSSSQQSTSQSISYSVRSGRWQTERL
jgi:hypothetical protein